MSATGIARPPDEADRPGWNITGLLRLHATLHGDRVLLAGTRPLTYAAMSVRIDQLAGAFSQIGMTAGQCTGIVIGRSGMGLIALCACLRLGIVPLLLPEGADFAPTRASLVAGQCRALIIDAGESCQADALMALRLAATLPALRHVLAFTPRPPRGVIAIDEHFAAQPPAPSAALADLGRSETIRLPAADGTVRARSGGCLLDAAQALVLEARMTSQDCIVSTLAPDDSAGLIASLAAALVVGASMELVQPGQRAASGFPATGNRHLVLPADLAALAGEIVSPPLRARESLVLVQRPPQRWTPDAVAIAEGVPVVDLWEFRDVAATALRRTEPTASLNAMPMRDLLAATVPPARFTLAIGPDNRLYAGGRGAEGSGDGGFAALDLCVVATNGGDIRSFAALSG